MLVLDMFWAERCCNRSRSSGLAMTGFVAENCDQLALFKF